MSFPNPPPGPPGPPPFHHGPPPPDSPFWDFIVSQTQNGPNTGFGVDHTSASPPHGFAFGPGGFNAWSGPHGFNAGWGGRGRGRGGGPPWFARGRGGRHGRGGHGHEHQDEQEEDLYDITAAAAAAEREMEQCMKEKGDGEKDGDAYADPPEEVPEAPRQAEGGRRRGCRGRRGGFFGRGRGGRYGPPFGGPPPWAMGGAGDWFTGLMEGFGNHPFAQRVREYVEQARRRAGHEEGVTEEEGEEGVFTPPVDVFDTVNNWTVHVAIPGAKKEDISVRWDADKKLLMITGVVHRPGDEEFIGSMVRGERKVGLFERKIQLPPVESENEKNDEVDGDHITAKMEDGILVIMVPKAEKEWTDIKKVDIL